MTDLAAMGEWNPERQVRHNDMWVLYLKYQPLLGNKRVARLDGAAARRMRALEITKREGAWLARARARSERLEARDR